MPDIVGSFLLFALVHSVLATETVKTGICRHGAGVRYYRLLYNLLALGTFAWVLATLPGSPRLYTVAGPGALVLRGIQAAALLLLCRCAAQTGLAEFFGISQLLTGREGTPRFTRTGCYRIVRHPQYTLATIVLCAAPVATVNYALFALLSLAYFMLGGFIEEVRLCEQFGSDYRRYQSEVPMFVPRLKGSAPQTRRDDG